MKYRNIRPGDVLFRFLPEYQVWHTGIVAIVEDQTATGIRVLEFDDSNNISLVSLNNYLWFRKYFWVSKFEEEMKKFGPSVFRTRKERLITALEIYKDNNLTYTINKYNCEYFVRRCVFNRQDLWPSKQTMTLSRSRVLIGVKLITIVALNYLHKFDGDLEYESAEKQNEYAYIVDKNTGEIKMNIKNLKKIK
ncbi:MAG: hypothetical protein CMM93_04230 [Rickettsiales bacterium]|nr:hypothetical protein [Rickettsiales bacterium]|tara:strand:- start:1583 stop:2161 length:579 start_codon:yes stop_codon:yes gene_type:complete